MSSYSEQDEADTSGQRIPPTPLSAADRARRLFNYRPAAVEHVEDGDIDGSVRRNAPHAPRPPRRELPRAERRRGRMCRIDGCENFIVNNGVCCRHGGSRMCSSEGCTLTAKSWGRCWNHGGARRCDVDGCSKRAKSKGRCWAHGGGTKCKHDGCRKVAVSRGLCWAHGGGRRCIYDGCARPGYERTHGFCDRHYESMQNVDYYEV
ncbi:hypothetical protein Poli38472_010895 [Pythium oligandrum]|uniref:WRKY19-like zinc finger domain-containing protein n=1 Tax=Pythium oligandrum TaxID=41045 RepID=A0A8K1FJI1_PYTOL|nr:hypothetical protein Poli38472_010895 [Pythium oligandrum]|eukprot:TMW61832.1 hypothetical protein Poli38472_010895 [Pythium oligandrum]